MKPHTYFMRIYIEDTDAGGIVYHANYLSFFSRARTEWIREGGIGTHELAQQGILFPVCTVEIAYRRPLVLDDEVVIFSEVIEIKKCSISFLQKIYRKLDVHTLICEAKIKVACVDKSLKPICIPDEIIKIMKKT